MNKSQRRQLDAIKEILLAAHFPKQFATDQTAICLLALTDRTRRKGKGLLPGKTCLREGARIRNILDFARSELKKPVAENTRESYRKQSLKPLYEAGIIELHQTSINDPNTFYTINDDFALILESSGKPVQSRLTEHWNATHQEKLSTIKARASETDIAIEIGSLSISLSPGTHSRLTKEVCEVFAPAYIPGFEPVYISDTRNKMLYVNSGLTEVLNISLDEHDKLPDVILYRRSMNIVYVIEVVTSVGPVSQSRKQELSNLLMKKSALTFGLVYVTAFPDRRTLRKFIADIAWETKAWIAEEHFGIINFDLIAGTL